MNFNKSRIIFYIEISSTLPAQKLSLSVLLVGTTLSQYFTYFTIELFYFFYFGIILLILLAGTTRSTGATASSSRGGRPPPPSWRTAPCSPSGRPVTSPTSSTRSFKLRNQTESVVGKRRWYFDQFYKCLHLHGLPNTRPSQLCSVFLFVFFQERFGRTNGNS